MLRLFSILSPQDGDSLTFRPPQNRTECLPAPSQFWLFSFTSQAAALKVSICLTSSLSRWVFSLPLAHVFICRVNSHGPGVSVCFFFMRQLEGSAACRAGTLPDRVVPPGWPSESVSKDMSVPVYRQLTSGSYRGPPTTKSLLDECIWRISALER